MKLLYTPTSPYVRKIRVLAQERGISLPVEAVAPHEDDPVLLRASAPGKVPVLVLDDGSSLQDSRVICAYLETQAGHPAPPFALQAREALAEAILDAAVQVVLERRRPEAVQSSAAIDRQVARIRRIVDVFEAQRPPLNADVPSLEQIGVAVSLAYLDFRLPDVDWRAQRPGLTAWQATFERRPSMEATRPLAG